MKYEDECLRKSMAELTIQQQLERERVMKTLNKVRKTDFADQNTKNYIKEQIPDIDISDIFRPKKVEKKEEDL